MRVVLLVSVRLLTIFFFFPSITAVLSLSFPCCLIFMIGSGRDDVFEERDIDAFFPVFLSAEHYQSLSVISVFMFTQTSLFDILSL